MTQPKVPAEWSVEYFVGRFDRDGEDSGMLFARAIGSIEGSLNDSRISDTERCRQIRNVIAAVDVVQKAREAAGQVAR